MRQGLRRAGLGVWLAARTAGDRLAARAKPYRILKVALTGDLPEEATEQRLVNLFRRPGSGDYFSLIALLRWAVDDEDLRGVIVSVDDLRVGWAKIQGICRVLEELRKAGKRVWVHFSHAGLREYLVSTSADRVFLGPSGVLEVAGISAEATFFFGALEKLGVKAEIVQVGQYKSAAEPFLRRDMSPQHREMIEAMVDDIYDQVSEAVGRARGVEPTAARDLLGRGPFVAREALEVGLVDQMAYLDQVAEMMEGELGGRIIESAEYGRRRSRQMQRKALRSKRGPIALVHVSGTLRVGDSVRGPEGAAAAGSATITADIERLEKRDDVSAVVLRIASPGGSGLASDLIWRAVIRLRAKKPVVISFGDVAASGGYYVAAAGAPVIAEPATITGSIGVLAGKANLQGLYTHLGITKDVVSRGEHAALYSDYLPLAPQDRARLESQAQQFYDDFLVKVAEGRHLTAGAVAAVAQGRVWTGRQARERGLVDLLGGIEDALGEAKVLAGIPRSVPVEVERYPKPPRFWRLSLNLLPVQGRFGLLAPWLSFSPRERVWAMLPFRLRFF